MYRCASGEVNEALRAQVNRWVPIQRSGSSSLAYLGRKEEVSEILDKYVVNRPGFGTDEDETRDWVEGLFLESAVVAGHRRAAEMMLNRLKDTGLYTTGNHFPTCITRHLGGAAALLGRYDEARQYYQEAIKVCTEMPFRPELALIPTPTGRTFTGALPG